MLLFYGHFYTHGRVSRPRELQRKGGEAEDETSFWYSLAENGTQVLYICGQLCYQLALRGPWMAHWLEYYTTNLRVWGFETDAHLCLWDVSLDSQLLALYIKGVTSLGLNNSQPPPPTTTPTTTAQQLNLQSSWADIWHMSESPIDILRVWPKYFHCKTWPTYL